MTDGARVGRWCSNWSWVCAVLAACTPSEPPAQPVGIVAPFDPYPGSASFCAEHVLGAPPADGGPPLHISWAAYHSADPPDRVIAHYRAALGAAGDSRDGYGHTWRDPAVDPRRTLSVHARGDSGPWVSANCALPPEARSVILIAHYSFVRP